MCSATTAGIPGLAQPSPAVLWVHRPHYCCRLQRPWVLPVTYVPPVHISPSNKILLLLITNLVSCLCSGRLRRHAAHGPARSGSYLYSKRFRNHTAHGPTRSPKTMLPIRRPSAGSFLAATVVARPEGTLNKERRGFYGHGGPRA